MLAWQYCFDLLLSAKCAEDGGDANFTREAQAREAKMYISSVFFCQTFLLSGLCNPQFQPSRSTPSPGEMNPQPDAEGNRALIYRCFRPGLGQSTKKKLIAFTKNITLLLSRLRRSTYKSSVSPLQRPQPPPRQQIGPQSQESTRWGRMVSTLLLLRWRRKARRQHRK